MHPAHNQQTSQKHHYLLQTQSAILHPYRRSYVKEYHSWFSTFPELLHLTGSEPLTLDQQFENHKSWLEDPSKYTFIIFSKDGTMIGDVNLFFSQWIEHNEAQINIMIAVPQYRGKGIAKQIMHVIQKFAKAVYKKDTIIAKIKDDNEPSIKFFMKIGYQFIAHNTNFGEKEYRKILKQLEETYKMKQNEDNSQLYSE